jgi:hypothetical protein
MAKSKKKPKREKCPKCGEDTAKTYECPRCEIEGCIEACNTGGNNCVCVECEQQEAEEEEERKYL